jgi:hypothetical protein
VICHEATRGRVSVESAYRGDFSRQGWTTEADLLDGQRTDADAVAGIVADRDARLPLAIEGGAILGCVLLRRESGDLCHRLC